MATVLRESELAWPVELFEPTPTPVKPKISSDPFDFDQAENAFRTLGLDVVEQQLVIVEFPDAYDKPVEPAQFISRAIFTAVRQRVQDKSKLRHVYDGLKEVTDDIEKHADKDDAVIILHRVVGGLALHAFSTEKEKVCIWKQGSDDYDSNDDWREYGNGETMLREVYFKGNYASFKDKESRAFERHILIPDDDDTQLLKIHHDD